MRKTRQTTLKKGRPAKAEPIRQSKGTSNHPVRLLASLIIVVALVVAAVHWPALSAKALSFDDDQYLTKNPLVQNPSGSAAGRFLTEVLEPSTVGGYYQPLTMISLMLDHASGGSATNLRSFHRTSLALHVANTSLVIVLLYMLFGQPWVAAMAGLLFGVHPMTVEPIPWVGERKTLLAAFFSLWCLVFYVRYARTAGWKSYATCLVMYVLALMSKPTSTPLPVVMLLLDGWPLGRLSWRAVLEKVPFFLIAGISANITIISQKRTGAVVMPGEYPPTRIPFILCHNIMFYLVKPLWPTNLTPHNTFPRPFDLSNTTVLMSVIGTCVLIPAMLISLRWTRALLTGWLIFFVTVFPTMNIIGFSDVIASDKFAYLPSVGLLMILAFLLKRLWGQANQHVWPNKRGWAVLAVVAVLTICEARTTRRQITYWQNTERIYTRMISFAPHAGYLYPTVGYCLHQRGLPDEAIEAYRTAIRLNPEHRFVDYTHFLLGNVLREQGKTEEAIEHYRESIRRNPNFADVYNNLGVAWAGIGEKDKAIQAYRKSLTIKQQNVDALNNLGILLGQQNRIEEATACYHKILQINPYHDGAYNGLAVNCIRQQKIDEAIQYFQKAIQINPNNLDSRKNLGIALAQQENLDEAIREFQKVLAIQPTDRDGRYLLADSLRRQGQIDAAIKEYRRVLQIDPHHAKSQEGLRLALAQKNK